MVSLMGRSAYGAVISVCPSAPTTQDSTSMVTSQGSQQETPQGSPKPLTGATIYQAPGASGSVIHVTAEPLSEALGCQSTTVTAPVEAVKWVGLLSDDHAADLKSGLLIRFDQSPKPSETEAALVVKEIQPLDPPPSAQPLIPTPMPLNKNLVPFFSLVPFGVEERVDIDATDDRVILTCKSGKAPAGVVFEQPQWILPAMTSLHWVVSMRGEGRFRWLAADTPKTREQSPWVLGDVTVSGTDTAYQFPVFNHQAPQGWAWNAWVLECPQEGGQTIVADMRLKADPKSAPPRFEPIQQTTWVWHAPYWRDQADQLIGQLQHADVNRVYIDVPLNADLSGVQDAKALKQFVVKARRAGISVWVVEGDPHDLLPQGQERVLRRAQAYKAFNQQVDRRFQLAGIQYDIEPYLMSGYFVNPKQWNQAYVALLQTVSTKTGFALESVLPFWFASAQTDHQPLLEALAPVVERVTVMDYRTNVKEVVQFAQPFLAWGMKYRKPVSIALETSPLPDETFEVFRLSASGRGPLWIVPMEGSGSLLVLFKEDQTHAGDWGYRYSHSVKVMAQKLTFDGQKETLKTVLPEVKQALNPWRSFEGIALHYWQTVEPLLKP